MKEYGTILEEYLKELRRKGHDTAKRKSNLMIFLRYAEETGRDLCRFTVRDAEEFQTYLATRTADTGASRYTARSVQTIMGSVSAFYGFLKKRRIVPANPFAAVSRLRKERTLPKNILSEETMDALLRHFREFWKGRNLIERRNFYKVHVIAELMYSTGCRIHEIASLTPSDIDFIKGTVRVTDTKTGTKRDAILNEYAAKVLSLYLTRMRPYVLFGKNNADMTLLFGARANLAIQLNDFLRRESESLGYGKVTSHQFRHAVGYHLLRGGCDIRHIQEILGHRALSTTQVYTKVDREDLKGVIDAYHPRRFGRELDEAV
jgi:integrase/recombinase XerD